MVWSPYRPEQCVVVLYLILGIVAFLLFNRPSPKREILKDISLSFCLGPTSGSIQKLVCYKMMKGPAVSKPTPDSTRKCCFGATPLVQMKALAAVSCMMLSCTMSPVELTPGGERIRVLTSKHSYPECEVLKVITSSDPVGGIKGTSNLLRNEAADLEGNAILMHPETTQMDSSGRIAITADVLRCKF